MSRRTCTLRAISTMLGSPSVLISTLSYVLKNRSTISTPYSSVFRTHYCRGQIAIVLADHHENSRSRSRFIHECSFCTNEHEVHLDPHNVLRPSAAALHDDSDRFCLSMPHTLRTSSDMDNVSNCVNVQFLLPNFGRTSCGR